MSEFMPHELQLGIMYESPFLCESRLGSVYASFMPYEARVKEKFRSIRSIRMVRAENDENVPLIHAVQIEGEEFFWIRS